MATIKSYADAELFTAAVIRSVHRTMRRHSFPELMVKHLLKNRRVMHERTAAHILTCNRELASLSALELARGLRDNLLSTVAETAVMEKAWKE